MQKTIIVILIIILSLCLSVPVAAADVSGAIYSGDIITTNSSGTGITGAYAAVAIPSANMVAGGYMESDYSDVAILTSGADTVIMPGQSSNPWIMYLPTLLAGQSLTSTIYTSGATGGMIRYFPGDTGMTVADSASLEPGDDFVIEWSGYVPATGTLIGKNAAFVLETIDSALHAIILAAQTTLGISSNTAITDNIYATSYTRIGNRFNSTGTAKYITKAELYLVKTGAPTGTAHLNVYNAATGDLIDTLDSIDVSTITGMTVHTFEGLVMVPGDVDAYVVIEYTGGDIANYINAGINTPFGAIPITRYQGGVWDDYANGACVKVTYNPVNAFLSDSITTGDHKIAVTADGTDMTLSVDGSDVDTTALAGAAIPDNGNAWVSCIDTPYMESQKITVSGTLQHHVAWQNAATFVDLSGAGHNATPTFRITPTSGDVESLLTAITAINPAIALSGSGSTAVNPISAAPTQPTGTSWHTPSFDVPIIGDIINDLLDVSDTPYQFFWYPIGTLILILISFAAHKFAFSLFIKLCSVIMTVILICSFNIFPWMVLPLIAIWNITIVLHSQRGVL